MHSTLHAVSLCLALFAHTIAHAQGWVGTYSPDRMMGINGLHERTDGSFLVTGFNVGAAEDGTRVMVIGPTGTVLGATDHDSLYSITYAANTPDGGFAILGAAVGNGTTWAGHALLRVDADGQALWQQHIDSLPVGNAGNMAIDAAPGGGFFCVFNLKDPLNDARFVRVKRLDASGGILWQRNYAQGDTTAYAFGIQGTADGGALVNRGTVGSSGTSCSKIDGSGEVLWTYTVPGATEFMDYRVANDGNILVHGALDAGGTLLKKLDQAGQELWSATYPALENNLKLRALVEVGPNAFAGLGLRYAGGTAMSLVRLDDAGHVLLQQPLPLANLGLGLTNDLFLTQRGFIPTSDGGFLCGGRIQYNSSATDPASGFLVKMDAQGLVYPGLLGGTAFADADGNCVQDGPEVALNGTILSFTNGTDAFHGVVATDHYRVGLGHGSYAVHATPISPYWEAVSCNPGQVELPASGDTTISFGFTPLVNAPYLVLDGYARERLCMPNTYTLRYCNTGTTPFQGGLQIGFGPGVSVDSASVPWQYNANGNVTFVDNGLPITECRTIKVHFSRPCDMDLMGRTFCIQADAFPNDMFLPGPDWDGSNLMIFTGLNVAADSLRFSVVNTGAPMAAAQDLLIHADDALHATIPVQLASGAVATHVFPANGSTYRGTVAQAPGNPYSAFATTAVEGAGTHPDGSISLGFVNDHPLYGEYAFHHTSCTPILNAYDPNRKTVVPEGTGTSHYVDSTATLEYTLEFQNTGTAEAYVVRLVDTLTTFLDPATLVPGAASHPYTWRFLAGNVVEFLFEGIHLPDSTTNEPGSHGFVRFRIAQRGANPVGTVIANNVGIYFDFNPPVITNTATVTVGYPLVTAIRTRGEGGLLLHAYPNPFTASTVIRVEGAQGPLTLSVIDGSGRVVKRQRAVHTDRFILDRDALPSGAYLFEVHGEDALIGHGKILVQ